MRRMHIGLTVDDVDAAVEFYSRLFGAAPSLRREDYAKWMLDDPYLNFSVDENGDHRAGSAHFGLQVDSIDDLRADRAALDAAGLERHDQDDLVCGYQLQHKSWVFDPDGVAWETFFTEGVAPDGSYGTAEMPDTP